MNSVPIPREATLPSAAATPSGLSAGGGEGRDDARLGDALAWYVYAVLPEGSEVLPDGVLSRVRVEALPCQGLTVLASRVPRGLFDQADPANRTGDPDWMAERIAEHHAVNAAAFAASPCLPMAFGVLFSNLDLLLAWLTPRVDALQAALAQVAKQTEWALALQEDAAALAAWLDENDPAVRQLAAAMEAAGEGTAFLMARRLDKARAAGRLKHLAHAAATVARCLAETGLGMLTELPRGALPSWTVLVPNRDLAAVAPPVTPDALGATQTPNAVGATPTPDALSATLTRVSDCLPPGLTLRLSGPWPAYAYARAALATEAAHG